MRQIHHHAGNIHQFLARLVGVQHIPDFAEIGFDFAAGGAEHLLREHPGVLLDSNISQQSRHGACGIFGTLAVGLFARQESDYWKQGLFFGGGADQLISQIIGVVAVGAFVAVTTGILFLTIKATIGLRVEEHEEIEGLDVLEHGSPGYAVEAFNAVGDTIDVCFIPASAVEPLRADELRSRIASLLSR